MVIAHEATDAPQPGHAIELVPCAKRVRAELGGKTILDTQRAVVLRETGHVAVYYVPREDVAMAQLTRTDHGTHCPHKGDASYYTVVAGGKSAENAAWSYERPYHACAGIAGWLSFTWKAMDRWLEEDEEVFVHARDPHVRVDILESHRPVEVRAGGEIVASTRRARFLFETGHATRYYIPRQDVRTEFLAPSESRTACPYKGTARYHHLKIGSTTIEDAVWFYPEPLDEVRRIGDYLCFYPEKVDAIAVDGKVVP